MPLENIYYIGQTIAVIAILGSLFVLIFQVRQANMLTRVAAVREQIDGLKRHKPDRRNRNLIRHSCAPAISRS